MSEYNGHKSWNQWNVSLWINNDETLYERAIWLVRRFGRHGAARRMSAEMAGQRTPDGARFNRLSIFNAMEDMK
jgi:hypothetical protein